MINFKVLYNENPKEFVKEILKGHKKLWQVLADNPGMPKAAWDGWEMYEEDVNTCCFACEFIEHTDKTCSSCPLDWQSGGCEGFNSPYYHWEGLVRSCPLDFNNDPVFKYFVTKAARAVRDIPMKYEVVKLVISKGK